jgi:hypothetical protein
MRALLTRGVVMSLAVAFKPQKGLGHEVSTVRGSGWVASGIYDDPPATAGGTDLITDASHLKVSQLYDYP